MFARLVILTFVWCWKLFHVGSLNMVGKLVLAVSGMPQFFVMCSSSVLNDCWLPSEWVIKRKQGRSGSVFYDLISDVTHCHFCHIPFMISQSLSPVHIQKEENWASSFKGKNIREFVAILQICHPWGNAIIATWSYRELVI